MLRRDDKEEGRHRRRVVGGIGYSIVEEGGKKGLRIGNIYIEIRPGVHNVLCKCHNLASEGDMVVGILYEGANKGQVTHSQNRIPRAAKTYNSSVEGILNIRGELELNTLEWCRQHTDT